MKNNGYTYSVMGVMLCTMKANTELFNNFGVDYSGAVDENMVQSIITDGRFPNGVNVFSPFTAFSTKSLTVKVDMREDGSAYLYFSGGVSAKNGTGFEDENNMFRSTLREYWIMFALLFGGTVGTLAINNNVCTAFVLDDEGKLSVTDKEFQRDFFSLEDLTEHIVESIKSGAYMRYRAVFENSTEDWRGKPFLKLETVQKLITDGVTVQNDTPIPTDTPIVYSTDDGFSWVTAENLEKVLKLA